MRGDARGCPLQEKGDPVEVRGALGDLTLGVGVTLWGLLVALVADARTDGAPSRR